MAQRRADSELITRHVRALVVISALLADELRRCVFPRIGEQRATCGIRLVQHVLVLAFVLVPQIKRQGIQTLVDALIGLGQWSGPHPPLEGKGLSGLRQRLHGRLGRRKANLQIAPQETLDKGFVGLERLVSWAHQRPGGD